MKRSIVWTLFLVAMLSLSLAAAAKENEKIHGYKCSAAKVAGTWGYSETGTMYLPAALAGVLGLPEGPNPYASVGSYTLDRDGNVSGERNASLGGVTLNATITGNATVNPDCTGTVILYFNNGSAGWAEKFIVYVDSAKEANMIVTDVPYPAVLTTNAKKISPGHGN